MSLESRARRGRRIRQALARTCPYCRQLWAVSSGRHPSGAWVFACRLCDWRLVVAP